MKADPGTVIVYESLHRILESLGDLAAILGERPVVLGRELTKLHGEFLRGTASEIRAVLAGRASIKGEMTLLNGRSAKEVMEGYPKDNVAALEQQGMDRMEAIKAVAKQMALPKREVYRLITEGRPRKGASIRHGAVVESSKCKRCRQSGDERGASR